MSSRGILLERFVPGDIFHVDTVMYEHEVLFAIASGYGRPPLEVAHGGGIFTTRILERDSDPAERLIAENRKVLAALGLLRGVSHTEYIVGHEDGRVYFLETSARVGGAHIAELVEAATGLNLWAEWAKVEMAGGKAPTHHRRRAEITQACSCRWHARSIRHFAVRRSRNSVAHG